MAAIRGKKFEPDVYRLQPVSFRTPVQIIYF